MKVLQQIATALAVIVIGGFMLLRCSNEFIRVSDGRGPSKGIIEHKLTESMKSEDLNRWETSSDLSRRVVDAVSDIGPALLTDPVHADKRAQTIQFAQRSADSASAIPSSYLAASHPGLPGVITNDFVPGMTLIAEGLRSGDGTQVAKGIEGYNRFLVWMQSQSRDDFRPIR